MRLSEARIFVVDTETTGLNPESDALVEIAALECRYDGDIGRIERGALFSTLVNPCMEMPPQAQAIHHISGIDVRKAPVPADALRWIEKIVPEDALLVAHNAVFDRAFLVSLDSRKWLCSKRLAQHAFPKAPAYNNQVLRYWLDVDVDLAGMLPHRASADVLVTAAVLEQCIDETITSIGDDVDAYIALAESPILLTTIPFGKHRGLSFTDVEADYLQWCLRNMTDIGPDLKHTILFELNRRHQEAA